MGRKKIAIEKIIDKNQKHVSFSKRRNGLFKMMKDTASKYNVEIASIVFSECGRDYSYGSHGFDTTIDKFIKDSQSTVSTVNRQKVERSDSFEEIRALIEEAKKCLSKDDNELIRVDELIKYRSDLQLLKDKLVEILESCCSKRTYKRDDSSTSEIRSHDMFEEPVRHELGQTLSGIVPSTAFNSCCKKLDGKTEEHARHVLIQTRKATDMSAKFNSYCKESVCSDMLVGDGKIQTRTACSLENFCGENGYVFSHIGDMSDGGEVSDSYWIDLEREGLFDKQISAPRSFANIGTMSDWSEVFGSSWTGLDRGTRL